MVTLPQPVLAPAAAPGPLPLDLGDAFTFLFAFDFFSTARRKNPVGLVEAFKQAFEPGDAQLVIKTFNGDVKPESLAQLERAAAGRDDIHVLDRFLPVEREGRAARARRRLRLAAPLRGLRALAGRGDAARQAGDRHRLLRQPRSS